MTRNGAKDGHNRTGRPMMRLAGLILVSAMLGGCMFNKAEDLEAYVEPDPPDLLYNQGLAALRAGDSKTAEEKFETIDKEHPYSDYARKSLIMSAFVSYRRGDYVQTITDARRYVSLFPASEDAAYAHYLIGESYFRQIPDITRDQTESFKAIEAMAEIVRKYPESEYADDARRKIRFARDQLAGKEMQIGRYYQERREHLAAINRFKVVVAEYQRTRHVEEALHRLTESYLALGVLPEAQTAAAVLGHNYPDSQWYKDSYRLLSGGGVQPKENPGSWISRAFRSGGDA